MNFPILSTLIFLPLISSFFIFLSKGKKNNFSAIYISLFSSLATFILSIFIWYSMDFSSSEFQFLEEQSWINNFIKFKLGIDYPYPIVKHENARVKALNAFKKI